MSLKWKVGKETEVRCNYSHLFLEVEDELSPESSGFPWTSDFSFTWEVFLKFRPSVFLPDPLNWNPHFNRVSRWCLCTLVWEVLCWKLEESARGCGVCPLWDGKRSMGGARKCLIPAELRDHWCVATPVYPVVWLHSVGLPAYLQEQRMRTVELIQSWRLTEQVRQKNR